MMNHLETSMKVTKPESSVEFLKSLEIFLLALSAPSSHLPKDEL